MRVVSEISARWHFRPAIEPWLCRDNKLHVLLRLHLDCILIAMVGVLALSDVEVQVFARVVLHSQL